ncbi:hypothetical protein Pcinc_008470 [Petrolisthes cinctipes]|uniref:Schwannomin interacting protein 1 C-terminal domain-containing protein n=1 Tax=Petrolisthes cinctipes TaxID=88211 RepID=A0AAE1KZF1_PETCI|nr:hypothetical protein Pcinc_008470 [Petrolisthes cinctipes]
MFGNFMATLQPARVDEGRRLSTTHLSGIPSLTSIKDQTAKISTRVFMSLKEQSNRVSKLMYNEGSETTNKPNSLRNHKAPPSLLEQLKWPVLINNQRHWIPYVGRGEKDEEDVVDKFIRVITIEDADERPQDTFYNHPARRRNDREEIRRKLAMGCDDEAALDRPHRKPSLHSRLQSGMNLQICFMNETASDCESQCSDTESTQDHPSSTTSICSKGSRSKKSRKPKVTRRIMPQDSSDPDQEDEDEDEEEEEDEDEVVNTPASDFFARQAQLQAEARVALAQAKEMARMQMEIEKQSKKKSPIADIVRASFNKIGVPFPDSKRRISRQILTDMNVAQLQVIVNDLHTQIESLNEELVTFLMERDDLHMEQDSMLVDIEDLTKHIGAKELSIRGEMSNKTSSPSPAPSLGTSSTPSIPSTPPLTSTPPLKTRTPSKLRGIVKK